MCEIASRGSFSKDDADTVAPAFINPDERPFDVGRDVPQDRIGGGMNVQSGSDQKGILASLVDFSSPAWNRL